MLVFVLLLVSGFACPNQMVVAAVGGTAPLVQAVHIQVAVLA